VERRRFISAALAWPALSGRSFAAEPFVARVVAADEPGPRLVVSGVVLEPDGKTPARGVAIDVYHTDAAGWYAKPENSPRRSRLRGSLTTGATGEYRIETVLPGHYADQVSPPPRHIHVHVAAAALPMHWIESYHFAGDPHLGAAEVARNQGLGRFSGVLTLATVDGVMTGRRDIRLDPAVAERNRLVDGWYR